jgi:hypothetical protein
MSGRSHEGGGDDDVLRKVAKRLQMMKERLLDQTSLLYSMGIDIAFDLVTGRVRDVRGACVSAISYKTVDHSWSSAAQETNVLAGRFVTSSRSMLIQDRLAGPTRDALSNSLNLQGVL